MKEQIKIACASLNQTPLDWDGNFSRVVSAIESAKKQKIDLVVFPELALTAYTCEDYFLWPEVVEKSKQQLLELKQHCQGITIVIGVPWSVDNTLYNCAAVIEDQKILGLQAKKVLADESVYYEPRWFKAWEAGSQKNIDIGSEKLPFGDLSIALKSRHTLGIQICEEAWHGELSADLKEADIIACLNASHFEMPKVTKRHDVIRKRSSETKALYVYCNALGLESGRLIFAGDQVFAHKGQIIQVAERLVLSDMTMSELLFSEDQSFEALEKASTTNRNLEHQYQDFTQAVCLALYDYLRKSGMQNYVISLSGGLDSAACAVLVRLMQDKLTKKSPKLYCIYQKTLQNSVATQDAAKNLAASLDAEFFDVDIDSVVNSYQKLNQSIFGEELSFDSAGSHDISLQNLQARARSILPWTIANERQAILITTSNRSESVVGYCTMDGDTAGGLAPIAGVSKHFLKEWATWLCKQDFAQGFATELKVILSFKPSAELKPISQKQEDEKELMPYEVLEYLEELFLEKRIMSHRKLAPLLEERFANYSSGQISQWLTLFSRKWHSNQWKRERIAPSFHLDLVSVDPKGYCRTPILSNSPDL